jgi:uncharacterized membrane protein (DUF106 family)
MVLDIIKTLPPIIALAAVSLFISLLVTTVYKFTTNQALMKLLHADMKSLRDEIKGAKDPSNAADLNKRLMEKTMQQIMHSMKSTMITIIPIFFIFGWMNTNLAYAQVSPQQEFTTTMSFAKELTGQASIEALTLEMLSNASQEINGKTAQWKLKGAEGKHTITYHYGNETYTRNVLVTNQWKYDDPILEKKTTLFGIINTGDKNPIKHESMISRVTINLPKIHPLGSFTFFGWQPGWLVTYFVFTMLFTFPIRKLFKVH